MTNNDILDIALSQHAVDCCCTPADFLAPHHVVRVSHEAPGARAYLKLPQLCNLVSYGSNVVACCAEELVEPVTAWLAQDRPLHYCFETPTLYGLSRILEPHGALVCYQAEYFLPDVDAVYGANLSCPYELRILGPDDFRDLYVPAWYNSLFNSSEGRMRTYKYTKPLDLVNMSTFASQVITVKAARALLPRLPIALPARPSPAARFPSIARPGAMCDRFATP